MGCANEREQLGNSTLESCDHGIVRGIDGDDVAIDDRVTPTVESNKTTDERVLFNRLIRISRPSYAK